MQSHTHAAPARRRNIRPGKDRSEQRRRRAAERRTLAAAQAGALLAAGGMLRLPEVLALVPVSASVWWDGCRTGRFPTAVKLSARCTAWKAADIQALLDRLTAGADALAPVAAGARA